MHVMWHSKSGKMLDTIRDYKTKEHNQFREKRKTYQVYGYPNIAS